MKYLYYPIIILCCILSDLNVYSQFNPQYTEVTIETPNNTIITVLSLTGGELSSPLKTAIKNAMNNWWDGNIQYQDEATFSYNCHGYAWHVSEGGSKVWIIPNDENEYWNDGSYVEVEDESEATKVSYGSCDTSALLPMCINCPTENYCYVYLCPQSGDLCDHSAVTTDDLEYFISKWGFWCLVKHHKNTPPYLIQRDGLMYFKRCREYYNQDITSDFTKEDCCEFILQNVTVSNNSDVVLKTKNYDEHKQINEYIQIDGPFEIQIGSTLKIQ